MKGHHEEEKENGERWLLTYADLITLLLAFFVIMFSMSNLDKEKYKAVIQSLGNVFGAVSGEGNGAGAGGELLYPVFSPASTNAPAFTFAIASPGPSSAPGASTPAPTLIGTPLATSSPNNGGIGNAIEVEEMKGVQQQVKGLLDKQNLDTDVSVTMRQRGLVISINSRVLFASGSASLTKSSKDLVLRIANILVPLSDNQILVEGHTDTDPISRADFKSNWALSSARATTVLELLLSSGKLKPTKFGAMGYGEYRPVAPNDTPENKAKNRRVNIVILKDDYTNTIDIEAED